MWEKNSYTQFSHPAYTHTNKHSHTHSHTHTHTGVLTITGARTEDSGMYVCSANGVEGVFSLSVVEIASGLCSLIVQHTAV